ncbi:MAG TPA: hypothetical protein VIW94_05755 [Acidimicrobiia bacterium]
MVTAKHHQRRPFAVGSVAVLGGIAAAAAAVGHPDITMFLSGASLAWLAAKFSATLARRVVAEQDPNLELLWDFLLVVLIVVGLVGVGLMSAPYL